MASDDLVGIADRLYAEPPAGFTPARDAAAREAGDKDLAKRIKALRKPTVAAWAVNVLVRREADQIDQVLALAESLREAAANMDGEELRALTRQRRQLTTALASTARGLARESGVRLSDAVVEQVEGTLTAAMLDPVAAEVVRSGLVLTAFTSTGVSEVDVDTVCAVPEALGHRATKVERPATTLRVVPDDGVKVAAARDRVEDATAGLQNARSMLARAERAVADLQARRLQLQGEMDELRRRLAALEDDVDEVDEQLEGAEGERDEAADVVADAERDLAQARAALERLES